MWDTVSQYPKENRRVDLIVAGSSNSPLISRDLCGDKACLRSSQKLKSTRPGLTTYKAHIYIIAQSEMKSKSLRSRAV